MRAVKRKIIQMYLTPAAKAHARYARGVPGYVGVAWFPKGGAPVIVRGCSGKREARARAMAEGRWAWREFRASGADSLQTKVEGLR